MIRFWLIISALVKPETVRQTDGAERVSTLALCWPWKPQDGSENIFIISLAAPSHSSPRRSLSSVSSVLLIEASVLKFPTCREEQLHNKFIASNKKDVFCCRGHFVDHRPSPPWICLLRLLIPCWQCSRALLWSPPGNLSCNCFDHRRIAIRPLLFALNGKLLPEYLLNPWPSRFSAGCSGCCWWNDCSFMSVAIFRREGG